MPNKKSDVKAKTEFVKILRERGFEATVVSSPADIKAMLEKHLALRADVAEAEQEEYQTRQEYTDRQQEQSSLEETALTQLDFSAGTSEAARLGRDLAAARA